MAMTVELNGQRFERDGLGITVLSQRGNITPTRGAVFPVLHGIGVGNFGKPLLSLETYQRQIKVI